MKLRAHTVLCVVTTAALGCGGRQPPAPAPAPIANTAAPTATANPSATPAVAPVVSRPLTGANGRPACGNVTTRAPQHCDDSATTATTGAAQP